MKRLQPSALKKDRPSDQSGFTLLEVLIAVSILCVGLLGVASMQVSAIQGNNFSDNTTLALTLAEQQMENLLQMNFTNDALEDDNFANNNDLLSIDSIDQPAGNAQVTDTGASDPGGYYRRIWNVADHPAAGEDLPTMKTITVIVTWKNDEHKVSITSIRME